MVRGRARFLGGALSISGEDGETELRGAPTVLAVGARPWIAPVAGIESASYLTSDGLLGMTDLPASLAIVGAGPIACEFAQALNRLGVEVTMALRSDLPLRGEEPEARETLLRVLREEGVQVVTGARRVGARDVPGGTELTWIGGSVTAEKLLVATGREPTVGDTDPGEAGIALLDGGARVDAHLETTARGVWALGDAIGGDHRRFQFTHVATHEGPQVAENALRGAHHEPSTAAMPRVTFTDPEVASVGLTEADAREQGIRPHTCVKQIRELGKARALGETEGFVKVVVDAATGKLVGATVMAAHAGRHAGLADDAAAHAQRRPRPPARDDVRASDAERGGQGRRARCRGIRPGARGGDDYLVRSDPSAPPPVGELLLPDSVLWSQFMSDCGERVWP